jgi:gluconate 2-dehydrogenase subunit 3-like protein
MSETKDGRAPAGPVRLGRREVLRGLAATAGAGFALPMLADTHPMRQHLADPARVAAAESRAAAGAPAFLDAHQLETLVSLAERVVPGSTAAGVAPFVDQLLAVDTRDNQLRFLEALGWLEGDAIARYGHPWTKVSESQQVELLTAASTAAPARTPHFWVHGEAVLVPEPPKDVRPTARDRFDLLKDWIAGAYFSSETGMREVGWTGQTFFPAFPGCPHPDGHR